MKETIKQWWVDKTESELPDYVKNKAGQVFEVCAWGLKAGIVALEGMGLRNYVKYFSPATKEEYEAYKKTTF